jgi:hypothetical protein
MVYLNKLSVLVILVENINTIPVQKLPVTGLRAIAGQEYSLYAMLTALMA